jgi:heparin binding hemagglutinin HbhA
MAVSLPTAADVRRAREQAARSAAERAELARTPLLAVLGAGELAVATVSKAVTDARSRVAGARGRTGEQVQHRLAELPQRMSGDELRKLLDDLRAQLEKVYAEFAERGEQTWDQLRTKPQLQQAVSTLKAYTDKLDAQVDTLVEEARDAGEKALGTVSRQTRLVGERAARTTQRFSAGAARTVTEVSDEAAAAVAETGAEAAEVIAVAGDDVAHETRRQTRTAANRTAPRTPADKATAGKPAVRRIGPAPDSDSS